MPRKIYINDNAEIIQIPDLNLNLDTKYSGDLDLRRTNVSDLGNLESVGGKVYLDKLKEYVLPDTIKNEQIKII